MDLNFLDFWGDIPDLPVSLNGKFKKPAREPICQRMKLILADRDEGTFEHSPAPVEQILREAGINPLEVVVIRNGKLISEDTVVGAEDVIRVIRVAHGG
jgi:sulfur carrier protein